MGGESKEKPKQPVEILPSRKRTNKLIRDIEFVQIMNNIKNENVEFVNKWIANFENKLEEYLNHITNKKKKNITEIHCRDINYILDTILERIHKLTRIERIKWDLYIEEINKKLLNINFKNFKCHRNFYNPNNKYIHIKKHMHDLCEDIQHIIKKQKVLQKRPNCNNIISRVLERWLELRKVYYTNQKHRVFYFDNNCTIDYIMTKFSGKECEIVDEPPKVMKPTGSIFNQQPEQDPGPASGTEEGTEKGPGLDPEAAPDQEDDIDPVDTDVPDFVMDMPLQLPPGEEPKLDTTYAAASLCGVSLIGAMIYKFKPFGFGSRAPGMRNGMGGYPFPHAANGDYDMGNFEYLQTGIPNNEYHLGYGPAADH